MDTLVQNKIVNVRLSPTIYSFFIKKTKQMGLKPSTFLKHVIISLVMGSQTTPEDFSKTFNQFLQMLPDNNISEKMAMDLVEKERKFVDNQWKNQ